MKKILLLSLLGLSVSAYSQVDVTASSGTGSASYTTLKGAFDKINDGTHQGDIAISITANTTETSLASLSASGSGSVSYTSVLIKPTTTVTVSGSINSSPIVRILGSNVTLDGSSTTDGTTRNLTIKNNAITTPYALQFGGAAAGTSMSNTTIKNTTFVNGSNSAGFPVVLANGSGTTAGYFTTVTFKNNEVQTGQSGLYIVGNTASGNGAGLLVDGNTFTSNIRNYGIYIQGVGGASTISNNTITVANTVNATASASPNYMFGIQLASGTTNANIYGNTIKDFLNATAGAYTLPVGIYAGQGVVSGSTTIHDNTISNFSAPSAYFNYAGIDIAGATGNVTVYSNKISGIKNTYAASVGTGIYLASTSTAANVLVYNNYIADITGTSGSNFPTGIYVYTTGKGYKIYSNTINLSAHSGDATASSACIFVDATVPAGAIIDLRNNIFTNNRTGGNRYAIRSDAANTVFTAIDYNDYYTTGSDLGYISGTATTTLANLQTGFGGNTHSLNVAPIFASAGNYHLKTNTNADLDNKGDDLSSIIATDIDGVARTSTPDMGAAEFTYVAPSSAPTCTTISTPADVATSVTPNPTILTWAAAEGAAGYKLYLGTTVGGTEVLNGTITAGTSYEIPLSVNTTYYLKVVPYNVNGDASSCSGISFTTGNVVYCIPAGGSGVAVYPISSITLNGVNKTSSSASGTSTPPYEDFTATSIELTQNTSYSINITGTGAAPNRFAAVVYVDWNQDGDFNDANEAYFNTLATMSSNTLATNILGGNISVPAGAKLGTTRMRVKYNFNSSTTAFTTALSDPCGDMGNGQTEDYTITVNEYLAVSDVNKANISVYPNPFTDVVNISDIKGVKSITVNDMTGRQVKSLAPSAEINLSVLNPGLYIVNIQMEDGSVKSFKTIKK